MQKTKKATTLIKALVVNGITMRKTQRALRELLLSEYKHGIDLGQGGDKKIIDTYLGNLTSKASDYPITWTCARPVVRLRVSFFRLGLKAVRQFTENSNINGRLLAANCVRNLLSIGR